MDLQFWIYLIIAIIYIVSRAMKKAENQPGQGDGPGEAKRTNSGRTATEERPRQLTFEELLKEITEGKQPARPTYQPAPQMESREVEVVDYDEQIGEEAQDLEKVDYDYRKRDKLYETYEEAKRMAFNRPSLEETMRVRDTNVQFEKFKEFEIKKQPDLLDQYTRDFKDPEGWKKAVVMSEILNRKFEY